MTKNIFYITLSFLISFLIYNVSYAKDYENDSFSSQKIIHANSHGYPLKYNQGIQFVTKIYNILSGDTIQTKDQSFKEVTLWGIDSPEYYQTCKSKKNKHTVYCGRNATNALIKFTKGQAITCITTGIDKRGRVLAECQNVNDDNINKLMVISGNAMVKTHLTTAYTNAEQTAQTAHRGIWNTTFEDPNAYRLHVRALHDDYASYMRHKKRQSLLKDSKDKKKGFSDTADSDIFSTLGDHAKYSDNLNDDNFHDHFKE